MLSVINKRQINKHAFIAQGENGYLIREDTRKELISLWQKKKKDVITHPFLQEKIPIGLLPYAQAQLLSRFLRGDLDNYPVFLISL